MSNTEIIQAVLTVVVGASFGFLIADSCCPKNRAVAIVGTIALLILSCL